MEKTLEDNGFMYIFFAFVDTSHRGTGRQVVLFVLYVCITIKHHVSKRIKMNIIVRYFAIAISNKILEIYYE